MKMSIIRVYTLLIWFACGYFGGFKWLGQLITRYFFKDSNNGINVYSKLVIYAGCILITIFLMFPVIREGFRFFKKEYFNEILTGFTMVCLMLIPLAFCKVFFGDNVIPGSNDINRMEENIGIVLFSSLVYAPIVEELICRAGIFYVFNIRFKVDEKVTIIVSAMIFSILHLLKAENSLGMQVYKFIIYFLLGIDCGYIYKKTDNILSPIITHLLWNACTLIGMLLRNIGLM